MGLIDFVKNAGASLFGKDEPEPEAAPAQPAGPSAEEIQRLHDRRKAARLVQLIEGLGFQVDDLTVKVSGATLALCSQRILPVEASTALITRSGDWGFQAQVLLARLISE